MNTDRGRDDGRITLPKMLMRDLRKLASNLGIITTKLVTHQMKSGWAGKGKGLLQVLWERGWIDESKISEYKKIVTDNAGFVVKEFSLSPTCLRRVLILQIKRPNLNLSVRVLEQRL